MSKLHQESCTLCRSDTPTLDDIAVQTGLQFVKGWRHVQGGIQKEFTFKDFVRARAFFNEVADISEREQHHPDMSIYRWKNVRLFLTTYAAGGLTRNDFIVAAKIDALHELFFE